MEETPTTAEPTVSISEQALERLEEATGSSYFYGDYDHAKHCRCDKPVWKGKEWISLLHPNYGDFCRCEITRAMNIMSATDDVRKGRVD